MLKQLFSIHPEPEDGDVDWPVWNHAFEHHGTRLRVIVGDLLAETEHEAGGHAGLQFGVSVDLSQEDVPEFYLPDQPNAKYDVHTFTLIFWRWGIYVSVRGRVYA
ncbi:hypothetical protein H7J86_26090 [Mycobacterium hackensackense]|uniref:hypothetical protein n=1 Tax=Mycobacterium hackensackense TaxID=228909 RepID=UPI00226582C3|nr:hypothetical protein [Mycobacterium hackensackense]MCV7255639.1 hypothetical protein [Mycobacterium hackensackense]